MIFDEAHMTVPAGRAPLAAQALQRLDYHLHESWIQHEIKDSVPDEDKLLIKKLTPTARLPSQGTQHSIGYDLYLDLPEIVIQPGDIGLLPTVISTRHTFVSLPEAALWLRTTYTLWQE